MTARTVRPYLRRGGGARQRMWDLLRRRKSISLEALMEGSGATADSVRAYLRILANHGYVVHDEASFVLVKNTGVRAPAVNVTANSVHDWNENPPMAGSELRAIWKETGLSLRQFGFALGCGDNYSTRLRQMMETGRGISPAIEAAARKIARRAG